MLAEHDRIRLNYFADDARRLGRRDLREFAGMLQRFTAAYDAVDDDWIRRADRRRLPEHARSND